MLVAELTLDIVRNLDPTDLAIVAEIGAPLDRPWT